MKLSISAKMWTHSNCTCKIMCMNGVWMWRTVKIGSNEMRNGIALSEEEAKEQAETASAEISRQIR